MEKIKRDKEKQLLFSLSKANGDFVVEPYKSSKKAGGQHLNKCEVAIKITHPESGAVGLSQDERSQSANKKKAFRRLLETKEFKTWHRIKTAMALQGIMDMEKELQRRVDEQMQDKYILEECFCPEEE
jgi:protein subunit release factor B